MVIFEAMEHGFQDAQEWASTFHRLQYSRSEILRSEARKQVADANFISMFSGAGGLDLGFESAGWSRLLANDIDHDSAETLRRNTKKLLRDTVVEADIRSFTHDEVRARAGGFERGSLTAIVGGPPCQSWSSAGHQLGMNDDRGQLFLDFVRLANRLDPRFIVMENVRGLLTARGPDGEPGSALAMIREDLRQQGWQSTVSLLNAADYGVPQRRVRLFIVAYREGDRPIFPTPSHSKKGVSAKPWVSLRSALSKVRDLSNDEIIRPSEKLAAELRDIRPGSGVKSPGKPETTRPGGHWGYKQGAFVADLGQPARTVTASTAQDWIIDPEHGLRRLSPRECAAIQTFPANWKWIGSRASVYRQIGNAVPPKLAEALARSIGEQIAHPYHLANALSNVVELEPLAPNLAAAIAYTVRDGNRNAASRLAAPIKRRIREG